jgi:hypothetical protein
MKRFHVIGEYGPQADNAIVKNYCATSPENARRMFEEWMKRTSPWLWEHRMGSRNVSVYEGWMH